MPPRPSPVYAFTPLKRLFVTESRRFTANSSKCKRVETQLVGGQQQRKSRAEKRKTISYQKEQSRVEEGMAQ